MKKLLFIAMLVSTGMTQGLFAQNGPVYYTNRSKTDQLFDAGALAPLHHLFVIKLKNSNLLKIRVANKEAFERLLNLDSMIIAVSKNLALLKDSLQDEM